MKWLVYYYRNSKVNHIQSNLFIVLDFHNYVCVASTAFSPRQIRPQITYHSIKNFREEDFRADIDNVPNRVSSVLMILTIFIGHITRCFYPC